MALKWKVLLRGVITGALRGSVFKQYLFCHFIQKLRECDNGACWQQNTSLTNTEGSCNVQEDLRDCKNWNHIQGTKLIRVKYKYSSRLILRVSVNLWAYWLETAVVGTQCLTTEWFMSHWCDTGVGEAGVPGDTGCSSVGKQLCYLMARSCLITIALGIQVQERWFQTEKNVTERRVPFLCSSPIYHKILVHLAEYMIFHSKRKTLAGKQKLSMIQIRH